MGAILHGYSCRWFRGSDRTKELLHSSEPRYRLLQLVFQLEEFGPLNHNRIIWNQMEPLTQRPRELFEFVLTKSLIVWAVAALAKKLVELVRLNSLLSESCGFTCQWLATGDANVSNTIAGKLAHFFLPDAR